MRLKGFTLIETLLSVAIIGLIAGVGIPVYQSFQSRNDVDLTAQGIVNNLRRAQALSRAVEGDTSWGVRMQSGSITLFRGTSYAARDTAFDEVSAVSGNILMTGIPEIVFAKFTGLPQVTGTIIVSTEPNETRTITLNPQGMVSY